VEMLQQQQLHWKGERKPKKTKKTAEIGEI